MNSMSINSKSILAFFVLVFVLSLALTLFLVARQGLEPQKGPTMFPAPKKIPHRLEIHGDVRNDDYFWMRERDTPPVLEFLKNENSRTAEVMAPVKGLEQTLYKEMRSRIKENDASVPVYDSG